VPTFIMMDNGNTTSGQMAGNGAESCPPPSGCPDALLVVRFGIRGLSRFLSHAETLRVFQRACARANLPVKFSQGFNPHPRLSLPLPRPVGVESEDECLTVRLFDERGWNVDAAAEIRSRLAAQLPEGFGLRSVALMKAGASVQPEAAQYVLTLTPEAVGRKGDHVRARAEAFLALDKAVMQRVATEDVGDRRRGRQVDVRPFVRSIQFEGSDVMVAYGVSNAGTIRVEEVLQLLDLALEDLAGPIQRRQPTWRIEN
jgi:radical SAM-linked protein